jgi:hypothetical protein
MLKVSAVYSVRNRVNDTDPEDCTISKLKCKAVAEFLLTAII